MWWCLTALMQVSGSEGRALLRICVFVMHVEVCYGAGGEGGHPRAIICSGCGGVDCFDAGEWVRRPCVAASFRILHAITLLVPVYTAFAQLLLPLLLFCCAGLVGHSLLGALECIKAKLLAQGQQLLPACVAARHATDACCSCTLAAAAIFSLQA
jgi:hypothetical protein